MNEARNTGAIPDANEMAFERTMLAHERTLMAWVRTAISMISFGFTIYKFFEETSDTNDGAKRLMTPRIVGMVMIGFGLLCLCMAQYQHRIAIKKIRKYYPDMQRSISSVLGYLVLLFGLALFFATALRQ